MVCPRRAGENTFFIHEGPRRKPLQGHYLVCPRRAGENTFFIHEGPRKGTKKTFARASFGLSSKDHEENLCKVIIWSVLEGRGRTPFLSTKGHERARRKPLQGRHLVCPRRAAKKTFARSLFGLSSKGGGEHLFYPRRATKDHEENLCKVIIWSVLEGPRRTPLQGRHLVCPRRAAKKTFCGRRRSWSLNTRIRRETVRFCPQAGIENRESGIGVSEGPLRSLRSGSRIDYG